MDRVCDYFHVAVKGTEKQFVEQILIVWLRFQCQRKGRWPRSLQSWGSVLQDTVVWSRKWGPKEAPASARVGESVLLYVHWCDAVWNEASAPSPPPPPRDDGGAKEPPLLDRQTQQNSGGMVFPAEGLNEVLKMSSAITSCFYFFLPCSPVSM